MRRLLPNMRRKAIHATGQVANAAAAATLAAAIAAATLAAAIATSSVAAASVAATAARPDQEAIHLSTQDTMGAQVVNHPHASRGWTVC